MIFHTRFVLRNKNSTMKKLTAFYTSNASFRTLPLASLLLVACLFFSCKKESKSLFIIPMSNLTFSVNPALDPFATHFFTIKNVPTNALAVFALEGVDTADIKTIVPRFARLSAIFNEEKLDFLREREVIIRFCPPGTSDTQEYCGREMFYRDYVPFGTGYDLDLYGGNDADVRDLLFQPTVDVRVILRGLAFPPESTFDVNVYMEFEVR